MNKGKNLRPPKFAQRFLEWYCRAELLEDLQGDLNEYFQRNCKSRGIRRARMIYIVDVLKFLRSYTLRKPHIANAARLDLLKNYSVTAFRKFNNRKLDTFLNILSLSIGLTSFILISLYVYTEFNYNSHDPNYRQIGRVSLTETYPQDDRKLNYGGSDAQLPAELREHYPDEIQAATGLFKMGNNASVKTNTSTFLENDFYLTDSSYFKVFHHPWIYGNSTAQLSKPNSIVLTETLSKKYFGQENPINKTLTVNDEEYRVTGVIEDLPFHSDQKINALVSLDGRDRFIDYCNTYVLFQNSENLKGFQQKLDAFFDKYKRPTAKEYGGDGFYTLEPLQEIHLGTRKWGDTPKANMSILFLLEALACIILFISCINYITITVSQLIRKQSEIGVRKTLGAYAGQIRAQVITETFLVISISFIVSSVLIIYLIPFLRQQEILTLYPEQLITFYFFAVPVSLILILSVLIGSYITFSYTQSSTLSQLKAHPANRSSKVFQLGFILLHLVFTMALVFSSDVIDQHMRFLMASDAGYNKEQILIVNLPADTTTANRLAKLKNDLKQLPYVAQVSLTQASSVPTEDTKIYSSSQFGDTNSLAWSEFLDADEDYFNLFNITLKEGRFPTSSSGNKREVVVNEAFTKAAGWAHPIGKNYGIYAPEIIGVVHDFNFYGLYRHAQPMVFRLNHTQPEKMIIKLTAASIDHVDGIRRIWDAQLKEYPMEYRFLNDYFEHYLKTERTFQKLLSLFTLLAVIVASLGLFASINIKMEQRIKEMCIRKIFGAQLFQLLTKTSFEYILILVIAASITFLITIAPLQAWLESFPYKNQIGLLPFAEAIFVVTFLLLLALAYQAIRLEKTNPLEGIKYE